MKTGVHIVRPWSLGPCPTVDELRLAWTNRRRSQKDFIWLLSVLGELTCFTDCNLNYGERRGVIGRGGGLKEFLQKNAPDLAAKYKSISRHATLAKRLKMAFNYYPPAPLSLLHPDLPLPRRTIPYILHYALNLREKYLQDLKPTYAAFQGFVKRRLKAQKPKYRWGLALPRSQWARAERRWWLICVRPKAKKQIAADCSDWYSRTYNPFEDYRYRSHGDE